MPEVEGDLSMDEREVGSFLSRGGPAGPAYLDTPRVLALARERVQTRSAGRPRMAAGKGWIALAGVVAALVIAIPVAMNVSSPGRHVRVISMSWAYAYGSISEIAADADLVVIGTVERIAGTESGDRSAPPTTLFAVQVERTIKGDAGETTIQVIQEGGQLTGGEWAELEDYPLMNVGDHVLLFLNRSDAEGRTRWTITGEPQGRLLVANGEVRPWPGSLALPIASSLPIEDVVTEVGAR